MELFKLKLTFPVKAWNDRRSDEETRWWRSEKRYVTLPAGVRPNMQRSNKSSTSIDMHETVHVFKMATLIAGVHKFDSFLVLAYTDWM